MQSLEISLGCRPRTPLTCDLHVTEAPPAREAVPPQPRERQGRLAPAVGKNAPWGPALRSHAVHGRSAQGQSRAVETEAMGPTAKTPSCVALSRKSLLTPDKEEG